MEPPESPYERAADLALAAVRAAPPLALVAVVAAAFELALARVGWNALPDVLDLETLRALRDLSRFPRNLAAVAGILGVVVALTALLRHPGFASIPRRLSIAAFSGIFVPSLLVATVLPYASLRARLVIFALAAANVLVTLVALTGLRYRAPLGVRIAAAAMALAAFGSLLVVGIGLVSAAEGGVLGLLASLLAREPSTTQAVLLGLRHAAELAWFVVPLAGGFAILHGEPAGRSRRFVLAALVLVAVVVACVALRGLIGHRFRLMVFAAFRFGLLLDDVPLLYAVPFGAGLGGVVVGLASRRAELRQLAAGLALWLFAGYAPHTPIQLLYLVLAALLVARAAQALDPRGPWRDRHPWLALMERASRQRSRPTAR
ncbi:MAG: hypothetical protein KF729_28870 [Sandaracinaceae bacterium]|nr:hypothetical protein [Sandaracinaceae bacterium]